MKKLLLSIVLITLFFPAMSQYYVYINGTITDSTDGYPIPYHAVTILSDSTNGIFYYNVVYTDPAGFYFDYPDISGNTGIFYVQTFDCNNSLHGAVIYYSPQSNIYTQDFQICNSFIPCSADFIYYTDSLYAPPFNFHFVDQSEGNPVTWNWNFGDGQTSVLQSPDHSYDQAGTYEVCLSITGADSSCYDFTCQTIVVGASAGCEAQFTYYPEPEGSPDSFQFMDLSNGNISSWSWSFGDGSGSEEQNPLHAYPGPGTYNACLTIAGNNCNSTICQDIVINDTVYHQLYGQVFAGNFPLQEGTVMLFEMNPDGGYSPFGEPWRVDSNGVYYFTLVPDGIYLIEAVPIDSGGYLPTYYGDVINWQAAIQVILGAPDNPYNINMVPAGLMTPGPGSVSGQITNAILERTLVDKINMILMNESGMAIGFSKVSSSGVFDFRAMNYGNYFLRAELPGVSSDNMKLEITAEKPHLEIFLNFSGNSILGLDESTPEKELLSLYPNPVDNQLNILLDLPGSMKVGIEIFNVTGQLVYHTLESCNEGQNTFIISLYNYPAGLYTIRVYSSDWINLVRKIIKTK